MKSALWCVGLTLSIVTSAVLTPARAFAQSQPATAADFGTAPPTAPATAPPATPAPSTPAAGTPAASAPAPAAAAPEPPKPPFKKYEFVLAILGNRRWLFDIPFWGLGGTFGVSLRPSEGFAVDLLAEHLRGESDRGLNAHVTRLRVPIQGLPASWLRVGGAVGFSYLSIERATRRSESIARLGLILGAEASADVVSTEDVSLFLNLRGEADLMWGNVGSLGLTGGVGIRL